MRLIPASILIGSFVLFACSASPVVPGSEAAREGKRTNLELRSSGFTVADEDLLVAEIATVGWDSMSSQPMVLLRELGSGQIVPIWVGLAEGQAIAIGLHEIASRRPMTHDLMSSVIRELGAEVLEVMVHDLVEGTYLGALRIQPAGGGEPLIVDTRPSDGLALAVRTGAAIRVHRKIVDEFPDFEFLPLDGDEQVVRSLGMTVVAVSDEMRNERGLPERDGVLVTRVSGEAATAGLKRGDLILEVNGVIPVEPMDFLEAVRASPVGEPVRLRYWRDGAEHEVSLEPSSPEIPRRRGPQVIA